MRPKSVGELGLLLAREFPWKLPKWWSAPMAKLRSILNDSWKESLLDRDTSLPPYTLFGTLACLSFPRGLEMHASVAHQSLGRELLLHGLLTAGNLWHLPWNPSSVFILKVCRASALKSGTRNKAPPRLDYFLLDLHSSSRCCVCECGKKHKAGITS